MAGGNAWPFFHFQLNQPEVGSESEPEKLYGSSQPIGILLSCVCQAASSCWSSASLASSSVIFELACANFSSAFHWRSCSVEAFFFAILTLSVRLLWWSLYHPTFLSDSEDASSIYGKQCNSKTLRWNNNWGCKESWGGSHWNAKLHSKP